MSNEKTNPRASLATARISLDALDKLRTATRGPLPTLAVLASLLGKDYESDDVVDVTGNFGMRRRRLAGGGADASGRHTGIRLRLDEAGVITQVTLFGDGDDGFSTWHGTLDDGLNMTATATDVRKKRGASAASGEHDGATEERYSLAGVITAFVYDNDAIAQVRLRKAK